MMIATELTHLAVRLRNLRDGTGLPPAATPTPAADPAVITSISDAARRLIEAREPEPEAEAPDRPSDDRLAVRAEAFQAGLSMMRQLAEMREQVSLFDETGELWMRRRGELIRVLDHYPGFAGKQGVPAYVEQLRGGLDGYQTGIDKQFEMARSW